MMSPEQKIWDSAIQLEYEQGSILNLMIICLGIGVHFRHVWIKMVSSCVRPNRFLVLQPGKLTQLKEGWLKTDWESDSLIVL